VNSISQEEIKARFVDEVLSLEITKDSVPAWWVARDALPGVLKYLKESEGYKTLFDLTAIDERARQHREGPGTGPERDYTALYHLLSYEKNSDIRIKVPLKEGSLSLKTITDLWPSADWYEREVWDMFGIGFEGHSHLRRILMPPWWKGHPLRKDHPARATEMPPFRLPDEAELLEEKELQFKPEEWGMTPRADGTDYMFLNLGPHHPGTHGLLRVILELDGEEIVHAVLDIGFHHRAAEKMGERQSWHTYIPYTDRVDYLAGFLNELPYLLSVEKLAGIEVPERARVIRVMLSELFRIASHLVWYGTFAQDLGAMSPVFYMFTDREKIFDIIKAICGGRMHPMWFRIGGVAQDLPRGWDALVRDFLSYMPARLREYDKLVINNSIFKARTKGVGAYTLPQAIDWGVTGPNLRACGLAWDMRKKRPYSSYEWFDFEIPTAPRGDCYARALVRNEEIRQSLRIIEQCLRNMPQGSYKSLHPLASPPLKDRTLTDIETLITHFLNVSWGPPIPPGEAGVIAEAAKGMTSYYLVSDGSTVSYRTRIRTPSFAHLQTVPFISKGLMIPDLVAILGSIDYVLADVDR
jgi:NADH-quinone oxidoreductase subunit C/D